MKRTRKKQNTARTSAATHNPRRLTDKQRAMVEMRKTMSTRKTAKRFNVPVSQVISAESVAHWTQRGEAMLAADPESLEGLSLTGVLSRGLANCLMGFCGSEEELRGVPDHQDYERISDVLRAGREVVRNRWAMGRVRWTEWLAFMQSRGLEWGKPLSDESPNTAAQRRSSARPVSLDYLLSRVMDIEYRLARLRRQYVSSLGDNGDDRDSPPSQSLETAGNLVCLPGVHLSDVLGEGGEP